MAGGWIREMRNGDRIHYLPGERKVWEIRESFDGKTVFCISSHDVGMPGSYDSYEAAAAAFDFPDEVLSALQESVNPGGLITLAMLQEAEGKRS